MTTFNFRGLPDCFVRMIWFFVVEDKNHLWKVKVSVMQGKSCCEAALLQKSTNSHLVDGFFIVWLFKVKVQWLYLSCDKIVSPSLRSTQFRYNFFNNINNYINTSPFFSLPNIVVQRISQTILTEKIFFSIDISSLGSFFTTSIEMEHLLLCGREKNVSGLSPPRNLEEINEKICRDLKTVVRRIDVEISLLNLFAGKCAQ